MPMWKSQGTNKPSFFSGKGSVISKAGKSFTTKGNTFTSLKSTSKMPNWDMGSSIVFKKALPKSPMWMRSRPFARKTGGSMSLSRMIILFILLVIFALVLIL